MKLVTFDDGKVGRVEGDTVLQLDVTDMRTFYERGQQAGETGATFALADVRLRAPIIPKKIFHTAGNFQEHHEESTNVNWSDPVLPWIVFFQNIDAIIGPDDDTVTMDRYEPGCAWETHAHPEDQITFVFEGGTVDFVVDGVPTPLSAGDFAVLPGGVPHAATVAADGERVVTVNVWRLRNRPAGS
jgi:mannose-6-phosphate isomerase-like protein (cupin superfamily)